MLFSLQQTVGNLPQPTCKVSRQSYTIAEILKVFNQVEGLCSVGAGSRNRYCQDMGFNHSMVRRWMAEEENLRKKLIISGCLSWSSVFSSLF